MELYEWQDFPEILAGRVMPRDKVVNDLTKMLAWRNKWINPTRSWGPWRNLPAEDAMGLFYRALGMIPPELVLTCKSPAAFAMVNSLICTYGFCYCTRSELRRRLREEVWVRNEPGCWGPWPLTVLGDVSFQLRRVGEIRPGRNVQRRFESKKLPHDRYHTLQSRWNTLFRGTSLADLFQPRNTFPWLNATHDILSVHRRRFVKVAADMPGFEVGLRNGFVHKTECAIMASYCFKQGASFAGDKIDRTMCNVMRRFSDWAMYQNIAVVCEFPTTSLVNATGNSHSVDGFAVKWGDGFTVRALDGIGAPEWAFDPQTFTAHNVRKVPNVELRRRLIDKMGIGRYVEDLGGFEVDITGPKNKLVGLRSARLLRLPASTNQDEIYIVEVVNSTPEPDGTYNLYHLPIDPSCYGGRAGREVLAAVASTWREFGNRDQLHFARPEDYAPLVES